MSACAPLHIRLIRLSRLVIHLLRGLATALVLFRVYSLQRRDAAVRRWARKLLRILSVRLEVQGGGAAKNNLSGMLVANHISWLDIFAIHAVHSVHFVSKSEVKSWPFLGTLASAVGTLFIERARRQDTLRLTREMRALLERGQAVAIFPEGTTTDGSLIKPFHASLFEPLTHVDAVLWPVAIRYPGADGEVNLVPAFIDDLGFPESLWRIVSARETLVHLRFLPAIPTRGMGRRMLAIQAEEAIAGALGFAPPRTKPGKSDGLPDVPPSASPPKDSPYPAR